MRIDCFFAHIQALVIPTDGAQPNQTAVVLNLVGMNKGVAYVNGFNIGRCEGSLLTHTHPPVLHPPAHPHWPL